MAKRGEVLVAILPKTRDLTIARTENWYRIPVFSAKKWLAKTWPPRLLAFYQPKIFKQEAFSINYFAEVVAVKQVTRHQLFPNEPPGKKSDQQYYQLQLRPLRQLDRPIVSRRFRRIVFIATTEKKFFNAVEINDLYDGSPLEDKLWAEFKRRKIEAERQEHVEINKNNYFLDFALYCVKGKINIETDGDRYHAFPAQAARDNRRNNDLESVGWNVLRFSTLQIQEQMSEYCVPSIVKTINNLGGLDEGRCSTRQISSDSTKKVRQLGLFDDM